jgi:hypothetical protein
MERKSALGGRHSGGQSHFERVDYAGRWDKQRSNVNKVFTIAKSSIIIYRPHQSPRHITPLVF